jgi:hypothetical protein
MWKKRNKPDSPKPAMQTARHSGQWHAVSVTTERYCCEAARGVAGRRFLAAEAPRLPLLGCSAPESCPCKFKHHADRRGPPRRKEDISGLRRPMPDADERRRTGPRRNTD